MKKIAISAVAMLLLSAAAVLALPDAKPTPAAQPPEHAMLTPADMKWGDAPPSLPPGAKLAVLEGDPSKPEAFTIRLRLPDGYKVAPHWHPITEHITVISGTLHIAMGDKFDDTKGTALGPGSFTYMGAHMHHYAWFTGDCEIQIHAVGPFVLNYLDPTYDPQTAKK